MKKLIAEDEYNIAMQYRIALENRKHEVLITYDGGGGGAKRGSENVQ